MLSLHTPLPLTARHRARLSPRVVAASRAALQARLNLLAVPIPQLIKPEVGASERALASLFERARAHAPCLLFIDELQALFGSRGAVGAVGRQMLSQLLIEIDHAHAAPATPPPAPATTLPAAPATLATADAPSTDAASPSTSTTSTTSTAAPSADALVIMGATNTPWALDPALLRPGRLEHSLYVPPPTRAARVEILRPRLSRMPLGTDAATLAASLADRTDGFSGADLASLCQRAAMHALRRAPAGGEGGGGSGDDAPSSIILQAADFDAALAVVSPSVTPQMLRALEAWAAAQGTADPADGAAATPTSVGVQGDEVPAPGEAPAAFSATRRRSVHTARSAPVPSSPARVRSDGSS